MSRPKQPVLEYRSYDLPADFPVLMLSGEHWRISPVPSKRLHIHNYLEIGLCPSDSGAMILGDDQVPYQAGYVTCVARNVPHTTWSDPGMHSLWNYLYVDPDLLLGRSGLALLPDLAAYGRMMTGCRFMLPPREYPWAMPLVQEILKEVSMAEKGYRICVQGLFLALVIRLLRIFPEENGQAVTDKHLPALTPALDYIYEHYHQTFPMEALADVCHMSPTHFRRLFHAQMGVNPLNFLHQVRILKSCTLLRTSEKNVAEIAAQVGYTSLSCFNQHFQHIIGCTPTVWRKTGSEARPSLMNFTGWLEAEMLEENGFPTPKT
ncbi:MAG: helix-turn-helix domain-containing protein [Clostridia bacterium]|nr:helix-turn-helix domain-containing protein [Clostridia bacterium]